MALLGTGAILIWNDITEAGRDDFYDWHIHEHIPERVAIPGFMRGRRYIAATPETRPEFFTLYETIDTDAMTSADYLARLNAPTDWTKRATAHFRVTSRALTRVAASGGVGDGGMLATLRFDDTRDGHARLARAVEQRAALIKRAGRLSKITGVHLCATDAGASLVRTAESKDRHDINAPPIGALLVEGCTLAAVQAATEELASHVKSLSVEPGKNLGYYRLEYARSKA